VLEADEKGKHQEFQGLAQQLAGGEQVNPDECRAVLDRSGRSAADLEAEVTRLKRVAQLRGIISREAELNAEYSRINTEWAQRWDRLEAERRAVEDEIERGKLDYGQATLTHQIETDRIKAAQRELRELERLS
jgi:hypothetical protein